jgi:hypothetical protein
MVKFKSIAAAVAISTASLAAHQAHATWFMVNNNCMSIEQLYATSGWPGAIPVPSHTPDDLIRDMNSFGQHYLADVTAYYPNLNPYVVRVLSVDGKINNILASNQGTCFELQARLADVLVHSPHPSPFR